MLYNEKQLTVFEKKIIKADISAFIVKNPIKI